VVQTLGLVETVPRVWFPHDGVRSPIGMQRFPIGWHGRDRSDARAAIWRFGEQSFLHHLASCFTARTHRAEPNS
jgi:hypothetical protein